MRVSEPFTCKGYSEVLRGTEEKALVRMLGCDHQQLLHWCDHEQVIYIFSFSFSHCKIRMLILK